MKAVYFLLFLALGLSAAPAWSADSAVQPIDAAVLSRLVSRYKAAQSTQDGEAVPEQSFRVFFGPSGAPAEYFVTMRLTDPRDDSRFVLFDVKGESVQSVFAPSESGVASVFTFVKVVGVGFKDVNGDGVLDVFAILSYRDTRPSQGEGVGDEKLTSIGLAYLSRQGKYVLDEDCGESTTIKKLESCEIKKLKAK